MLKSRPSRPVNLGLMQTSGESTVLPESPGEEPDEEIISEQRSVVPEWDLVHVPVETGPRPL